MDVVVQRRAGLDVHKDTVVAAVQLPGPEGTRRVEVRTFGTMTVELLAPRDWLVALGCRITARSAGSSRITSRR